jgi:hypothetical protein
MQLEEITLGLFAACNSFRIFAYIPRIPWTLSKAKQTFVRGSKRARNCPVYEIGSRPEFRAINPNSPTRSCDSGMLAAVNRPQPQCRVGPDSWTSRAFLLAVSVGFVSRNALESFVKRALCPVHFLVLDRTLGTVPACPYVRATHCLGGEM